MHYKDLHTGIPHAFRAGEQKGINSLFKLHYKPLCLFAFRLLNDLPGAEDIVGESFIKLWERHADFESFQAIRAFLYITTRNACLNLLKQKQREALSKKQLAYLMSEKEEFVLNEMIRAEVLGEIMDEINNLPAQCGRVFRLSYLEGLNNDKIAEKFSISVNTVRNQKARAIQLLKIRLLDRRISVLILFSTQFIAGCWHKAVWFH